MNYFRQATIIAIFLLCAVFSVKAQIFTEEMPKEDTTKWKDTIAVVLLVCDTSIIRSNPYWINAYSVRDAEYDLVDVSVDPNEKTYLGRGIYSTTLLGWIPKWENKPIYKHLKYLDNRKKPLSKNILVWQVASK